jgi:competence protein ComEC
MTSRSLGHRAPLLWLVLPLIAGSTLGRIAEFTAVRVQLGGALIAAVGAVIASRRFPRLWPVAICGAMVFTGTASYTLYRARLAAWDTLPPREARLSLRVDRVFAQGDPKRATGLASVTAADAHLRELVGQAVYFSLTLPKGETPPIRSSVISAVGVLTTLPRNPPTDSFDGFLAGSGINFRFNRGRVLAEEKAANAYYRLCARAAERTKEILGLGIAQKRPALAGLLRAMMLGETHELNEEQHTLFMQSGTMHLFAISGLNIAVIAGAVQALLMLTRLPAWVRFLIGTALLWLFVDITGAAPSAVRAFGMAVFLQAAFLIRRAPNPLAAIAASALVVLLIHPLQVFSASFLMSYGIVVALLVLGLPLGDAWLAWWTPWRDVPPATWNRWQRATAATWRWLAQAVAIGVAATLVSLLTGVEFFRLLTPGALIANLVLIPAAMLVTLAGIASAVCGLAGFGAGAILFNHAAALVLLIIEWLVRTSVRLPGAFIPAQFAAPWVGPIALVLLMLALGIGYTLNWRRERGGWWPPFAIVALTLIFGVKFG